MADQVMVAVVAQGVGLALGDWVRLGQNTPSLRLIHPQLWGLVVAVVAVQGAQADMRVVVAAFMAGVVGAVARVVTTPWALVVQVQMV